MKTVRNIVLGIFAALVLLPVAVALVLQIPTVQTFVAHQAAAFVSRKTDGQLSVGHVSIAPLHTAILKDVCILDAEGDTIAAVRKLTANLSSRSVLSHDRLIVHRVCLDGCRADIRYITPEETNIGHFISQLAGNKENESGGSLPWKTVTVRKVRISDVDFRYRNRFAQYSASAGCIDFNDIHVRDFNLKLTDISYSGIDDISAKLASLSFTEVNSGFSVRDLKFNAKLGKEGLKVRNLHLDDGNSSLKADCTLSFKSLEELSSFTESVPMDVHFDRSYLDIASAGPFSAELEDLSLKVWLSGDVHGTVSGLKADNLRIESESGGTVIRLEADLTGLPEIEDTFADISIPSLTTTISDLEEIIASVSPSFKKGALSILEPCGDISLKGSLNGPFKNFRSYVELSTEHGGQLTADVGCRGLVGGGTPHISGTIDCRSIALGRFLKDTSFGNATLTGDVSVDLGDRFSAHIDNARISEFLFHGYDYRDITLSGAFCDNNLAIKLGDDDPNLTLKAEALARLGSKGHSSYLAADIDVIKADLAALKFDKREVCSIDGHIKADVELTPKSTVIGKAGISSLRGHLKEGICDLGDINLEAMLDDGRYRISMDSNLADASYEGSESMGELISDVKVILARELGNILQIDKATVHRSEGSHGCRIVLKTGDLKPLTTFFLPDMLVGRGTSVNIDLDGSESLALEANVPFLAIGDNSLRNLTFKAGSTDGPIRATVKAELLSIGDFVLRNNHIVADIRDNIVDFNLTFDNKEKEKRKGNFFATVDFNLTFDNKEKEKRKGNFFATVDFPEKTPDSYIAVANIESSHLEIENCIFNIDSSRISYRDKFLSVDDMRITCGADQYLSANGIVSDSPSDTLAVVLNKVDLSMLNNFLNSSIELHGVANGRACGFGLFGKQAGLIGDINTTELAVGKERLGDLRLLCKWDEGKERFNVLVDNNLDGRKPVNATGFYKPSDKTIGIDAAIDRFAVCWLDPFLTGIVSEMGGSVSGDIKVEGPLDRFRMSGKGTRFNDLTCKVDFTQVPYVINGPFSIDEKGIRFQNDTIADLFGNNGRIEGGVTYDRFNDINLGVRFRLRDMLALNTTAADEENGFYGKAFATGRVNIDGPLDRIALGIDIRTGKGAVHIPLNSSGIEKTSILTFTDSSIKDSLTDPDAFPAEKESHHSSLGVNVKLNITNLTEVGLDINRSLGDMLKAHGTGNVEINVGEDLFDIKGGYNIEDGSYKLALMGITSKDFIINPGGTINFNGDIMQSDLGITATYRTKASIGTLIADSTSINSRRTVNCGIGIGGKLANPQLSFDIDIPDLDPTTQGLVQSALSTEEKRLKQILALLVSGSFVPDEQSGIVNNTTVLYSNASEIMANQINNIFRQLDIPLDLGFNYQPGSGGVDIFDVAISTQLFNNRVTINGNIGNQDYLTTSNTSEVVGNVDMEIKINKSGKLRLNLFSHAADRYSNYLDQTQRNGAGIVFQEEFDTFRELINKICRRNSRKRSTGHNPERNDDNVRPFAAGKSEGTETRQENDNIEE